MTPQKIATIVFVTLAVGIAGCATNQAPQPGLWIYVPTPSIDKPEGSLALVALCPQPYTTNRIDLSVTGQVRAPGPIRPPEGCTVLQAIGYAGGFTDFAFTRRLRLVKGPGQTFDLFLQSEIQDRFGHKRVWYALDKSSRTDYVLEAGDSLHVRRTI